MPKYTYKKKTKDDLAKDNRTKFQKKFKLGSVREAVLATDPHAYDVVDDIMTSDDETKRQPKEILHAAGKKAAEKGFVCEVSIAGSEFTEFRAVHKHLPGKSAIQEDVFNKEVRIEIKKPLKVHWWNKFFGKLPFVNSPEQIQQINDDIERDNQRVENALKERYGDRWFNPKTGKEDKYIRIKEHSEKVHKISLPGPPGLLDRGDRSINSLRERSFELTTQYLKSKLDLMKSGQLERQPITVMLRGHSRGAVAAGESMQMITQWVNENYPDLKNLVNYNLMQYDPVPGYTSHKDHDKIDFDQKHVGDKQGLVKRGNSEPKKTNSTVFYSLQTAENEAKKRFFDPQEIRGCDRIILAPMRHMIDLAEVDASQVTPDNETYFKPGYSLAENGNLVRGSGMTELPKGIFIMDENNTLVQLKTPQQVLSVLQSVWKDTVLQPERQATIYKALGYWFDRNLPSKVQEREHLVSDLNTKMGIDIEFKKDSKDLIAVKDDSHSKENLAKAIYLASIRDNAQTMTIDELKNATTPENYTKNVEQIQKSDAFKDIFKQAKGNIVSLNDVTNVFETAKIKYPGKVNAQIQPVGQIKDNDQPELNQEISMLN